MYLNGVTDPDVGLTAKKVARATQIAKRSIIADESKAGKINWVQVVAIGGIALIIGRLL